MVTGVIRTGVRLIALLVNCIWLCSHTQTARNIGCDAYVQRPRFGLVKFYQRNTDHCLDTEKPKEVCPFRTFAGAAQSRPGRKAKKGAITGTLEEREALIEKSRRLGISQEDIEEYVQEYVVVKKKSPVVDETADVVEADGTATKEEKRLPKRLQKKIELLPEKGVEYSLDEAIDRIKLISGVRFTEGIDVALRVPLTKKKIRATAGQYARLITIPYPSLKSKRCRIAVFAKPEICQQIRELNPTKIAYLGGTELIEEIKASQEYPKVNFVLSDLATFHKLSVIGRLLGRKGLMPSLTNGTCIQHTEELLDVIQQIENRNTFILRADRAGDVKCNFADVTMPKDQIRENLLEIVKYLRLNKPPFAAAQLFSAAYVSSSMGPSFKISLKDLGFRTRAKKRKWY